MVRTQIQLTDDQARQIRRIATERGISISEAVRRLIDRGIRQGDPPRSELYARAASVIGKFEDREGADNLAGDHDRYLDEAYQ